MGAAKHRRPRPPRASPADLLLPPASGRRFGAVRWGGASAPSCEEIGPRSRCVYPVAFPLTVAAAPGRVMSSPSSRSGSSPGRLWSFCRARSSVCAPLAGRGGEGRSSGWLPSPFWCRWCWWSSSSTFELWPALVVRGAASGVGVVVVVVGLGGGASAGSLVELGCEHRGRVRSMSLSFVARRRTTLAASTSSWRCFLSGGWRYGDGGAG